MFRLFFCLLAEEVFVMRGSLQERMLPAPVKGGFSMDGYWVWCGSVIRGEDGRYHMFASRWSKEYPMHPGWLVASEIVRAVSDTPEGPYQFQEVVLPARGPQYWDGRSTHNPQITKCGDTYLLYYLGTTNPFPDLKYPSVLRHEDDITVVARANKRIGVATSNSVFGPWKRLDAPILSPRPGYFDNFFTSNPAPCIGPDGGCTMLYKTRTYLPADSGPFLHGQKYFGAAQSKETTKGFRQMLDIPLFSGSGIEMEDPFIWLDQDGYNLMAKDMNGAVCGERMGGIYASSQDGIHWELRRNFLFYSRNILWDDGVVREMGNLERPFLLLENGVPTHVFFATSDGKNGKGFMECTRTWNMVIPLRTDIESARQKEN